MKKNKNSYLVALLSLFSSYSYAQAIQPNRSTQFEYLNIKDNTKNPSLFGYDEVTRYLHNKEREKKIKTLSSYISNKYKVERVQAEQIVKTSFTESERHNIEPILMLSIIGVESTFDTKAVSGVGAIGLTQVMPKYHKSKISKIANQNLDLFSIKGNIIVGAQIIKEYLFLSQGNLPDALQRYNGSLFDKNKSYSKKVFAKMKTLNAAVDI